MLFAGPSVFGQDQPAIVEKPIKISDFSTGMGDWFVEVKNGAQATSGIEKVGEDAILKIEIVTPGPAAWNVQLLRSKLGATKGQNYKVTFEAKATGGLHLWCQLQEDGGSYGTIGQAVGVGITENWKECSVNFSAEGIEEEMVKARLIIGNLGVEGKTIWLKNFKWTTVAKPEAAAAAEKQ